MTATRTRNGALFAALFLLVAFAVLSPAGRPLALRVARHFHFIAPPPPVSQGQALGSIPVQALDGSSVSLTDRTGRAMLINVFASWCSPCNEEMPALSRAAGRLAQDGIDVVGIDQAESSEQVQRFVAAYGVHYPVYLDSDSSTRGLLGARVIPTTLFVDRRGVVRIVHVGPLDVATFLSMARETE